MKEPPDQTAVFSAANLLSFEGMIVPKYCLTISSCSRRPESMSRNSTPWSVSCWDKPSAGLEVVVAGLIRVRDPGLALVVVADLLDDLSLCLCCHNHHFPSTPNSIRPAQRAMSNGGTKDRSDRKRKSPASRT